MRSTRIDHGRDVVHVVLGGAAPAPLLPARCRTGGRSVSVPARRPRRLVPGGDGDGDGGGHDEHVAQRRDPPLVHAVVVRAELHLALVRGDLHRVRRALVVARLLRGARPHVADHACARVRGQVAAGSVQSVRGRRQEETGKVDRAGSLLSFAWEKAMTRFVFLIRSTISPRLFDAADTVWSFHFPATRRDATCQDNPFSFRMQSDDVQQRGSRQALTVRHRDQHLVALGQRRPGPRVVEVEVEVVLRQRRPRVLHPLVLPVPAAAGAAPSSQRRSATQRCDMPDSQISSSVSGDMYARRTVNETYMWRRPR